MSFWDKTTFCANGHTEPCQMCFVIQCDTFNVYHFPTHFFFLCTFPFQYGSSFRDHLSCSTVQSLCSIIFLIWVSKWYAAWADALAAVQQITQPLPPMSCTPSGSISLMDSDEASVVGTQGGSFSTTTKKKQVGNVKPVPKSVVSNTQELRMTLPNHVFSPSVAWSYHSNWYDDLSPTCHTTFST